MHAASGRGGRRAKVKSLYGSRVHLERRSEKELTQVGSSTIDVAADQVCIVLFELVWRHKATPDNQIFETWGVALELIFVLHRHIGCRAAWHVAIDPQWMSTVGSPCRIEQRRL